MKKEYIKPAITQEWDVAFSNIICASVINPGQPNTPPGARRSGNIWDDEEADGDQSYD